MTRTKVQAQKQKGSKMSNWILFNYQTLEIKQVIEASGRPDDAPSGFLWTSAPEGTNANSVGKFYDPTLQKIVNSEQVATTARRERIQELESSISRCNAKMILYAGQPIVDRYAAKATKMAEELEQLRKQKA